MYAHFLKFLTCLRVSLVKKRYSGRNEKENKSIVSEQDLFSIIDKYNYNYNHDEILIEDENTIVPEPKLPVVVSRETSLETVTSGMRILSGTRRVRRQKNVYAILETFRGFSVKNLSRDTHKYTLFINTVRAAIDYTIAARDSPFSRELSNVFVPKLNEFLELSLKVPPEHKDLMYTGIREFVGIQGGGECTLCGRVCFDTECTECEFSGYSWHFSATNRETPGARVVYSDYKCDQVQ